MINACLLFLLAAAPVRAVGVPLNAIQRSEVETLVASTTTPVMYDSELGWAMRPAAGGGDYRNNSAGLAGRREYSPEPAPGVLRVAAFGYPGTYGPGLRSTESWKALISSADARIEILDYGVPAYGLDQDLLRYRREGERFHPQVVLIGYMTECLQRNIMTFRPYWNEGGGMPFSKPRFILEGGKLALIPNPIAKLEDYNTILGDTGTWPSALGAHDWFYHARAGTGPGELADGPDYKPKADGFLVVLALLEEFSAEVRRRGAAPLIVVFPDGYALDARLKNQPVRHQLLFDELKKRGLDFVDLGDALTQGPPPSAFALFTPDGRAYTAATSARVADELRRQLTRRFLKQK